MAEVIHVPATPTGQTAKRPILFWILGLALCANAILLWLGLTEDAITVGKTLKKEVLGFTIRLVDERQTFSILGTVAKLRIEGSYFLFCAIFLFSILFPILKWFANVLVWVSFARDGAVMNPVLKRVAGCLHWLGKWSMLEVFVAGLLCVLLKLGQVSRFKIENGMYWFFAAVILSLVNAHLSAKMLRLNDEKVHE